MSLSLLAKLSMVSRLDGILAQINAERLKLNTQLKEHQSQVAALEADAALRAKSLSERKAKQAKQEKELNEERQKLVERRKALSSFSGKKVQEAAEREISAASDLLNTQEESLILGLGEIEILERSLAAAQGLAAEAAAKASAFRADLDANLVALEQRQRDKEAKKTELLGTIEQPAVSVYNRARDRFPQDAVVAIKDRSCSGCFQSLVAQTVMQVQRAETVIKCPGCGRVLCLESHLEEGKVE